MQLFNFTPLKRYDLCAGALALTLGGGGPEVGVLRHCPCSKNRKNEIPIGNICLDCVNNAEKLRLTSEKSSTFIKGSQTFYDKPTNSEDTFTSLDKEIPVFDLERLNSIIDTDIAELSKERR